MSVKRYTHVFVKASGSREMFEDSEEGEWVGYEDYAALEKLNKELREELTKTETARDGWMQEAQQIKFLKTTVERYEKALKMAGLDDIFISEALKK